MVYCQPPVAMSDNSADMAILTLKMMYDLYGDCAASHALLIQWLVTEELQSNGL